MLFSIWLWIQRPQKAIIYHKDQTWEKKEFSSFPDNRHHIVFQHSLQKRQGKGLGFGIHLTLPPAVYPILALNYYYLLPKLRKHLATKAFSWNKEMQNQVKKTFGEKIMILQHWNI